MISAFNPMGKGCSALKLLFFHIFLQNCFFQNYSDLSNIISFPLQNYFFQTYSDLSNIISLPLQNYFFKKFLIGPTLFPFLFKIISFKILQFVQHYFLFSSELFLFLQNYVLFYSFYSFVNYEFNTKI